MSEALSENKQHNKLTFISECNFKGVNRYGTLCCQLYAQSGANACSGENKCIQYQIYLMLLKNNAVATSDVYNNTMEELIARMSELKQTNALIEKAKRELAAAEQPAITHRAADFLKQVLGDTRYQMFKQRGYIELKGTNEATYRIDNRGNIERYYEILVFKIGRYAGRIVSNDSNVPLDDGIAIVCMNILADSDRFDEDKRCGNVSVVV